MKYVILDYNGLDLVILADNIIEHHAMISDKICGLEVLSAGFCNVTTEGEVRVWGTSTSLKTYSRAEDAKIIKRTLIKEGL